MTWNYQVLPSPTDKNKCKLINYMDRRNMQIYGNCLQTSQMGDSSEKRKGNYLPSCLESVK